MNRMKPMIGVCNSRWCVRCIFLLFWTVAWLSPVGDWDALASPAEQRVEALLSHAEKIAQDRANHMMVMKLCNEAIRLQPREVGTHYRCGLILGRMGDYVGAVRNFSYVITNDGSGGKLKYPAARKLRADCFMGLGMMQNAIDDYSHIVKENPKGNKTGKIWFYLAEAFALANRKDLALNAIEQGCATGSHWCERMRSLQQKIIKGEEIIAHQPLSN